MFGLAQHYAPLPDVSFAYNKLCCFQVRLANLLSGNDNSLPWSEHVHKTSCAAE